jgi:hypothetical protein
MSFKNILYPGLIATAVILVNSCEGPPAPEKSSWREITAIPYPYYELKAASLRGVYLTAGEEGGGEKLVYFDGREFKEEYAVFNASDHIDYVTLPSRFLSNAGFMSITRETPCGPKAVLLIRSDGWAEILENVNYGSFAHLCFVGDFTCWMVGTQPNAVGVVLYYNKGQLTEYDRVERPRFASYVAPQNTFYCYFGSTSGEGGVKGRLAAFSPGYGNCGEELITVPAGFEIERLRDMAAGGDALYFVAEVETAGVAYEAVIKRTGPPGDGVYELSFLSRAGPGFLGLEECGFSDAAHGMAVGMGGSIYYDAPIWSREYVENPGQYLTQLTPDPRGGFWADYYRRLMWHP